MHIELFSPCGDWQDYLSMGAFIGNINCCAPTCMDDVAILELCKQHLWELLYIMWFYKGHECYLINAEKSAEVQLRRN